MASVALKNIYKSYPDDIAAVTDFNLDIKDGEIIVFVGPSGCGKTTTLRMIAGLESITKGELYIDGRLVNEVHPKDRGVSMMFQNYALFPHMTVFENIAFGLKPADITAEEIKEKVEEIAGIIDIAHLFNYKPHQISGGQKQRVALARALIRKSKVVLFDEPLSNLDSKLRVSMRAELLKLHQKFGATFIHVTHDQIEAMALADRIVVMKDGLIKQVGTPEYLYSHPDNLFLAGFIGSPQMNFWKSKVTEKDGEIFVNWGEFKIKLSEDKADKASAYINKEVWVGVRPEDIRELSDFINAAKTEIIEITVKIREFLGDKVHLHFGNNYNSYTACASPDCKAKSGDKIKLFVNSDKIYLFDIDTELAILN